MKRLRAPLVSGNGFSVAGHNMDVSIRRLRRTMEEQRERDRLRWNLRFALRGIAWGPARAVAPLPADAPDHFATRHVWPVTSASPDPFHPIPRRVVTTRTRPPG